MEAFRDAVLANHPDAMAALLADDVTFLSPVAFKPYEGKPLTAALLRGAMRVFKDFEYVREIHDGADHALEFVATVDGKRVNGCDFIHVNDDGLIDDFKVMMRPLSAVNAMAAAMGAQFDQIVAEATAEMQ